MQEISSFFVRLELQLRLKSYIGEIYALLMFRLADQGRKKFGLFVSRGRSEFADGRSLAFTTGP
jgi:hypothetical protein